MLTIEQIPMSIKQLLNAVIEHHQTQAKAAGLALSIEYADDLSPSYLGDPTRLMQILNNLVSNAIKFTPQGFIQLTVHPLDPVDDTPCEAQTVATDSETPSHPAVQWVQIDVRDSGIGIAAEALAGLFTPFVQADGDTTRRYGGSGLGLSICKELAEAMGGDVGVLSIASQVPFA